MGDFFSHPALCAAMQWTPRGAHLLLQVRTQVLNEDWDNTFRRWYPHFRPTKASATPLSLAA